MLFHTEDLGKKVQSILGDKYVVEIAMRYQNPSIESALKKLQAQLVSEIIVLPLFPSIFIGLQWFYNTKSTRNNKQVAHITKANIY